MFNKESWLLSMIEKQYLSIGIMLLITTFWRRGNFKSAFPKLKGHQ